MTLRAVLLRKPPIPLLLEVTDVWEDMSPKSIRRRLRSLLSSACNFHFLLWYSNQTFLSSCKAITDIYIHSDIDSSFFSTLEQIYQVSIHIILKRAYFNIVYISKLSKLKTSESKQNEPNPKDFSRNKAVSIQICFKCCDTVSGTNMEYLTIHIGGTISISFRAFFL